MSADTISTEQLVEVCEAVEPGDEVELENASLAYKNPLEVVETDVVEWLNPNGNWFTAVLVLEGNQGGEHRIAAVEGDLGPRDYTSGSYYKVYNLDPVGDPEGKKKESDDDPSPLADEDDSHKYSTNGALTSGEDVKEIHFEDFQADPGNGVECQGCGSRVSKRFTRVMEPEEEGAPRVCPNCTDLVRTHTGEVREARSTGGRVKGVE